MSMRRNASRKAEGWAKTAEEQLKLQLPAYVAKYTVLHLARGGHEVQRLLYSGVNGDGQT